VGERLLSREIPKEKKGTVKKKKFTFVCCSEWKRYSRLTPESKAKFLGMV